MGYRRTYFLTAFLSVLVFVIGFFYGNELEKLGTVMVDTIMYSMVELPIVLFILSVRNLYVKVNIPRVLTIANIVLSLGIIVMIIIAVLSYAGGTMIG